MNSKIKIILFDVGNVLVKVNFENSIQNLIKKSTSSSIKNMYNELIQSTLFIDFELNRIGPSDFIESLQKKYGFLEFNKEELFYAWNSCLSEPMDGVEQCLMSLKDKAYFYALSNTNKIHYDYFIKKHNFFNYFEKVFTSFEFEMRKPQIEIYEKTYSEIQKKHSCRPSEVLFIDDLYENVESAACFGFTSELMLPEPHYLKKLLEKHQI
jgi:HAD superfamily hydrolase (TIGR01509 family)